MVVVVVVDSAIWNDTFTMRVDGTVVGHRERGRRRCLRCCRTVEVGEDDGDRPRCGQAHARVAGAAARSTGVVLETVQRHALRCGQQEERHHNEGETTPQLYSGPQPPGAAGPQISTLPLRTQCHLRRDQT